MRKLIFIPVFSFLFICFSCSRIDKSYDFISIKKNENGNIDLIETRSGKILIKDLSGSFADSLNNEVRFPAGISDPETETFSDEMGSGTEYTYAHIFTDRGLKLNWVIRTIADRAALACRLEIENTGSQPVRINRIYPLSASGGDGGILMNSTGPLQYLDIEPETWMPKAMKRLDKKGISKFVTGIASPDQQGAVIGCITFERFRGVFEFEDHRESSGRLSLETWHEIDDHLRVGPGGTLSSEWMYLDCADDVLTGLEQWAELAGSLNNAVVSDPPATGFYTWYYYRDYVSEKIMMDNTRFLSENRDKFPVNYVHIDWGWQRNYSSGDTVPNDKFPHGLKWLAAQIRDHGFTPSIWCNPFMYTHPTATAVVDHPGIFRRDTAGHLIRHEPIRNIMARMWGDAEYMTSEGVINVLDVSIPETYDFLEERYRWVRSTGYDMAMMDFIIYGRNNYDEGDRLKYSGVSTLEGIRKALTHAKIGLGQGSNILGCGAIYEPIIGVSNLTRISYDATANWKCVKIATKDLILQYYMNNRLWTNYADGLFVRDKASPYWGEYELDEEGNKLNMYLTDDEAQFFVAVNGLSQAAVMYTEDIQRLKPERQWLLSMVLPIYQGGKFRPVDLFRTIPSKTLQLECGEGSRRWMVAAGLNWTDQTDERGLDLSLLNLEKESRYHAFDVFGQEYLGLTDSQSDLGPVNPHGVLLVTLTPEMNHPQVIGTDLHISQGGMEIRDEKWDESEKTLSIELGELYGRRGHVFVFVPSGYSIIQEPAHEILPVSKGNVAKIPVVLDKEKTRRLRF